MEYIANKIWSAAAVHVQLMQNFWMVFCGMCTSGRCDAESTILVASAVVEYGA